MALLDAMWPLTRRVLFQLEAEQAHELTLRALELGSTFPSLLAAMAPGLAPASLRRDVAGLPFLGPVGLAAGLDKDGRAVSFWPHLGFGFLEVGTVTAHAQPGNDRPRLFRYPEQAAIINRMGFPNRGSRALAARLRALRDQDRWPAAPLGVNLGKSKGTPLEEAPKDYVTSIERLRGLADWFTVNVSSPNTAGLRDLQAPEQLRRLLGPVLEAAAETPIFLKLAPDLADEDLLAAVSLARSEGITGFVATNTTVGREGFVPTGQPEAGGLSGRPLWPLARQKIAKVLDAAGGLPVIGVGGIERPEQVKELLEMGCAAVQLYSALVFSGPGLVSRLNAELAEDAERRRREEVERT